MLAWLGAVHASNPWPVKDDEPGPMDAAAAARPSPICEVVRFGRGTNVTGAGSDALKVICRIRAGSVP